MNEVRTVGRPKGSVHKVPHTVRIAKILTRFGVTCPVEKIKSEIARLNKICKPENQIALDNALNVKIAQVRSKMLAEQTGVQRVSRGRMTLVEKELANTKLELARLRKELKAAQAVQAEVDAVVAAAAEPLPSEVAETPAPVAETVAEVAA